MNTQQSGRAVEWRGSMLNRKYLFGCLENCHIQEFAYLSLIAALLLFSCPLLYCLTHFSFLSTRIFDDNDITKNEYCQFG